MSASRRQENVFPDEGILVFIIGIHITYIIHDYLSCAQNTDPFVRLVKLWLHIYHAMPKTLFTSSAMAMAYLLVEISWDFKWSFTNFQVWLFTIIVSNYFHTRALNHGEVYIHAIKHYKTRCLYHIHYSLDIHWLPANKTITNKTNYITIFNNLHDYGINHNYLFFMSSKMRYIMPFAIE